MADSRADSGPSLVLGTVGDGFFKTDLRFGPADVASHKHVIGITGQGKSRLLQAMFVQLLHQGVGVSLIDPHRDLARDTLRYLIQQGFFDRPEAYERLIYIDFSLDRYVPFNVLKQRGEPHDVAYFFLEAIKRAWPSIGHGSAPNLENILLAGTEVLIEAGHPITRMPCSTSVASWITTSRSSTTWEACRILTLGGCSVVSSPLGTNSPR